MRKIDLCLDAWARASHRKPLLLRGARQVGKTFAIERVGKTSFKSFCKLDFEQEPELRAAFDLDLVPERILKDLSQRKNMRIIPGETLLFFDEIQACPKALMSLRYFYEQMPSLHVVAAGSLLEFVLQDPNFSFPVGRIETLYVRPLSFLEFLRARAQELLIEAIQEATLQKPVGAATHLLLLRLLKEYFLTGGMPRVVYGTSDFIESRIEQRSILEMYSNDFGKYSRVSQQKYLRILFERAPYLVGERFKYSKIDPDVDAKALRSALDLLARSGLIHQVFASSGSGIPLGAQVNEKKFKLLFLDIGLLNGRLGAPLELLSQEDLTLVHGGALAEQFVGQEWIAHAAPQYNCDLFYWEREKKGSEAEVDYLFEIDGMVVPVEVKAGKSGKIRSLKQFLLEKSVKRGVRISQLPLVQEEAILSIPLYMVSELPRIFREDFF